MPLKIIEKLHSAPTDNVPLAEEPLIYFSPEAITYKDRLDINMPAVQAFMYDHGVPEGMLQQPLFQFLASELPGQSNARVLPHPSICNNKHYYPHIQLEIDTGRLDVSKLNARLRHELRHLTQYDSIPSFSSERFTQATKLVGKAVTMYAAAILPETLSEPEPTISVLSNMLLGSIGVLASIVPTEVYWLADPREWDAEFFSWRHRGFNPITLNV